MLRARDDLAVALDSDGFAGKTELVDEARDGGSLVHHALLPVDDHVDLDRHRGQATTVAPGWLAPGRHSSPDMTRHARCKDRDICASIWGLTVKGSSHFRHVGYVVTN